MNQFKHIKKGLLLVPRFERISILKPIECSDLDEALIGPENPVMVWGWTSYFGDDEVVQEVKLLHNGEIWFFPCSEEEPWYDYFEVVS